MKYSTDNIISIMKLLAAHFGEDCEVVLHDFSQGMDKSIIAIENGHVSNREEGSSVTDAGLEMISQHADLLGDGIYNYITRTEDGRIIRSSSAVFRNPKGKIIGSLCINQDISKLYMVENLIKSMTKVDQVLEMKESFVKDVSELIQVSLMDCVQKIGKPISEMGKEDKWRAIDLLESKGIFSISKSNVKVCEALGITKYFLYSHLNEIRAEKTAEGDVK